MQVVLISVRPFHRRLYTELGIGVISRDALMMQLGAHIGYESTTVGVLPCVCYNGVLAESTSKGFFLGKVTWEPFTFKEHSANTYIAYLNNLQLVALCRP